MLSAWIFAARFAQANLAHPAVLGSSQAALGTDSNVMHFAGLLAHYFVPGPKCCLHVAPFGICWHKEAAACGCSSSGCPMHWDAQCCTRGMGARNMLEKGWNKEAANTILEMSLRQKITEVPSTAQEGSGASGSLLGVLSSQRCGLRITFPIHGSQL